MKIKIETKNELSATKLRTRHRAYAEDKSKTNIMKHLWTNIDPRASNKLPNNLQKSSQHRGLEGVWSDSGVPHGATLETKLAPTWLPK